ncbi:interleukin-1 receptor-associated kinase 1 [Boleophthalmus pectinirostris]|uniref:interleukin-1 receptor-associated kinase 1 n=1 Tax=Boleophthalmus pectinirostris TaxID=150288 RepID=UPI00242D510C|nr:interleukin-1 receptor-associated kinase 1 [Boleophthalmus pectinirostris]
MAVARADLRALPLYKVPSPVHFEFCRVMDVLSDRDWTNFASEVLQDQTAVRLAEREEQRTHWLMLRWQNRNGTVGQLLDLLQRLELLRPWDIINNWVSSVPPPVVHPLPSASAPGFIPSVQPSCPPSQLKMPMVLPKPEPPEIEMPSMETLPQPLLDSAAAVSLGIYTSGVMSWAYEEVHAGTCGFCASLKIGEGGFGEVFRANLRNMDCAVKKIKQECPLDWSLLRDSFQTEVEKLSKFRHPNIVDLLGYSDGGGTLCLIYSFMENRSLDDRLHLDGMGLSWCQRVSIVKGAATALQYLHCPPEGQTPLVHGDVKSSNILMDHHFEAKLADFGLARFASRDSSGHTAARTCSIGQTQMVRGTLAYLPEEYIRDGKLKTEVDVYSFGVVLLEILTGRRALKSDKKTGQDIYLKELVNDIEDTEAQWRRQLDERLISCGLAEPSGFMQVVSLARSCLDKWKKRPSMIKVYKALHDLHTSLKPPGTSRLSLPSVLHLSATSPPPPGPPRSLDSCFSALSLSKAGPSEHTFCPKQSSLSPPQTLHSTTVTPTELPSHGSSLPPSSFDGPCETDESRGYSQYEIKSNGLGSSQPKSDLSRFTQPSVPTEDQYNFSSEIMGPMVNEAAAFPEGTSPAGSLQSLSVVLNPSKQRLLEKTSQYNQGLIRTPELLSEDLYLVRSPAESRLPEESDELEYLQSKTQ